MISIRKPDNNNFFISSVCSIYDEEIIIDTVFFIKIALYFKTWSLSEKVF